MMWTYAQVKAADVKLAISDLTAATAALNAQIMTATNQTFTWLQAKTVAQTSITGDWSRIVARSRQTPTIPPVTGTDVAILAAINATEMSDTQVIDPTIAAGWSAVQSGLSALQTIGDLSSASVSAINALTTVTSPVWSPALTAGDVQTARAQP